MKKVPVGATISFAYRFAFGDFLRILGVMWPSLVLIWVPSLVMRSRMMTVSGQIAAQNFSGLGQMWPLIGLLYIVALILVFMQLIGISQLALERHKGPVWFYFSFTRPMWRLIGSFLLLLVLVIAGWIVVLLASIVTGLILSVVAKIGGGSAFAIIAAVVTALVMLALWCAYFYCLVRFSFLVTPVVASEEEGSGSALLRSWTLSKGNFWRMFAVLLVVILPLLAIEGVVVGFMFKGLPALPQHPTAEQSAALQAAMTANIMDVTNLMNHYWYIAYPVSVALMVVFYGSLVGAQCFAYRALTEDEASAAIAFD